MGCGTSNAVEIIYDSKKNRAPEKGYAQRIPIMNNIQKVKKDDGIIQGKNIEGNKIPEKQQKIESFKNTSSPVRKNILETLDREKIKKLVLSCKKRTEISLNEFIVHFKDMTKNLTSAEKAYALFYWMAENIAYDANGYFSGVRDVTPEGVYRNGYGVCSGYSRLFKYIGTYIGLNVICVSGYAKGVGYSTEHKISGTNHEWNMIQLDGIYYPIDSTWGAGYLNGRYFQKEFKEFYFCPEPEQLFSSHFPVDPKWQLITPSLSVEEFAKRIKFYDKFYKYFTKSDLIYHTIQVKNKYIIRFYKKAEKVKFLIDVYDENKKETDDMQYLVKEKKDYVDLIYIFKHKGKYSTGIYANDGTQNMYDSVVQYNFESLEEWGDKRFDFSMDDYDTLDKFKLESLSHKDFGFKAKNREKLFFKFKPNSEITIDSVTLKFEDKYEIIKNVTKYYKNGTNVDVEVIFNKKGNYKLLINCLDLNTNKNKSLIYYPVVESDAEEPKEFSEGEMLITQPFEDSLNKIKLKNINQKNQNITANRIEQFEFECEDKDIIIDSYIYPDNSKILKEQKEQDGKYIFYFGFNENKKIYLEFKFYKNYNTINSIIYIVDYQGEIDIPFSSPESYDYDIILIDPIFPKLQIGKEVTLKFKSDTVNEIIAINEEWLYIKKNEDGIFEVKITPTVEELKILKKKENSNGGIYSKVFKVEKNN